MSDAFECHDDLAAQLERIYAPLPVQDIAKNLRDLLPRHKTDSDRARQALALGYPAIAPILSHLMHWTADGNWPISIAICPLLAALGDPIVPEVWRVLQGEDYEWKWFVIVDIIGRLPMACAEQFRTELERMARSPTKREKSSEVDEAATITLETLGAQQDHTR